MWQYVSGLAETIAKGNLVTKSTKQRDGTGHGAASRSLENLGEALEAMDWTLAHQLVERVDKLGPREWTTMCLKHGDASLWNQVLKD